MYWESVWESEGQARTKHCVSIIALIFVEWQMQIKKSIISQLIGYKNKAQFIAAYSRHSALFSKLTIR